MYEKDQAVLEEVRDVNAEIKNDAGINSKNGCGPELLKEHLSDFSTKGMLYNEITADIPASKPEEPEEDPFGDEGPVLGNLKHITEHSPFMDILPKGHLRALQSGLEDDPEKGPNFIFTEDEIEVLLNDPDFLRCKPEMAEQLRRQMNSS